MWPVIQRFDFCLNWNTELSSSLPFSKGKASKEIHSKLTNVFSLLRYYMLK